MAKCVKECQNLEFPDFEVLILPDGPIPPGVIPPGKAPVRVFPTGPVGPAQKRDLGMAKAQGEILAIIDDDAYPVPQWLSNAAVHFSDPEVAAVGGPAVTPPEDTPSQQASGAVYASLLVSGGFSYRYLPGKMRLVDDFPSCNFIVRKSALEQAGGFNTKYWPGEDTKLCLDITVTLKKKIVYDPAVLVYHHRRRMFKPHLVQIANYALHRGFFVKKFPQTSLRPSYFIPSAFVAYLAGLAALPWMPAAVATAYPVPLAVYLLFATVSSIRKPGLFLMVLPGIILTHITYGIFFLKGLSAVKLKEDL